ncbi:hypothetical protein MRGA327_07555 [Mycobacterium tuberculosis RGTB327]|nr:hypothetical protein MRGA327_07555 [Mycobacterium tuberculosis RGTB327]
MNIPYQPRLLAGAYSALSSAETGPLAADREPLQQPHGRQDQWGRGADGHCRWNQPDSHGCQAHDQQCGDQGLLAAEAVSKVSKDGRAERPG